MLGTAILNAEFFRGASQRPFQLSSPQNDVTPPNAHPNVPPAWSGRALYFPVPVNMTACGELLALSLMFRVAVRVPAPSGVKVTEIVHLELGARFPPQVFVGDAKSPGLAPVNVMAPMARALESLLISVTFLAALVSPTFNVAYVKETGETVACAIPVPDNEAVCGLFEAASVTVSVAASAPTLLGVNVMVIVHLLLAATLPLHVSVSAKSGLPVVMLEMVRCTASALDSVMFFEALAVF